MPNIVMFNVGMMHEKLTGKEEGNQLFMLYLSLLPTTVKPTIVTIENENVSH